MTGINAIIYVLSTLPPYVTVPLFAEHLISKFVAGISWIGGDVVRFCCLELLLLVSVHFLLYLPPTVSTDGYRLGSDWLVDVY